MIKVEKLSYSFPEKELYKKVSFTLENGQHAALIGSNGTGKSTLVDMLMDTEKYLYDGKIVKEESCRMGYVSQFAKRDKEQQVTVFEFLSEDFVRLQEISASLCAEMAVAENLEAVFERYQSVLDEIQAVDGDNYEVNIHRQLKVAGMSKLTDLEISKLSGGEYKLLQVIRQMLLKPDLLIMDEPDVFLDFENLNGLRELINSHKGTLLVITHNRYLLNHCFDKILHLENGDIQEFDGNYTNYNFSLMQRKMELQEQAEADTAEIERYQKMVDRLRQDASVVASVNRGKAVNAKATQLARLEARRIKEPFVNIRQPEIQLPKIAHSEKDFSEGAFSGKELSAEAVFKEAVSKEDKPVLQIRDLGIGFEEPLLEHVSFELHEHEKVAIVGPNGTGKTTLLREVFRNRNLAVSIPAISVREDVKVGFLSQIHSDTLNEDHTIYEEFEELGFQTKGEIAEYLGKYCFEADTLSNQIAHLSGGEKNLLQIAKLAAGNADFLLLDEPTSHLDTYAQMALEKALAEYKGAVLMVSHDFYTIAGCADYVLYVENHTLRRMSIRVFRKMIYQEHFDKDYLELEQKKKELETRIELSMKEKDFKSARKLSEKLEEIIEKL